MDIYQNAYDRAIQKIVRNAATIGVAFPQAVVPETGLYNAEEARYWTSGFWGGLLWLAYRETKDHRLFELACEIEEALDGPLNEFIHMHHDVGFLWLPTAVEHFRVTGNGTSRTRGLKAAAILASRFNLAGRFIRAWEARENCEGWAIIDCLMNLPLLYWASRVTGDPRFRQIAIAHTDTALKHFVRPDHTVPHILGFDPDSGAVVGPMPGQGRSLDSVWSRGQAWAIYGFGIAYRETGDRRYWDEAVQMAERFYQSLPEDFIPYWDFQTAEEGRFARDSSAACIAASGMLELARHCPPGEGAGPMQKYADTILGSLIQNYACLDDSAQGIIRMGTVNYTAGRHINTSIIYGDFYFIEALAKRQGVPGIF